MENSLALVIAQKYLQVYLLTKFLEIELLGQRLCAFVILIYISAWPPPIRLYQLTPPPGMCERIFSICLLTQYAGKLAFIKLW